MYVQREGALGALPSLESTVLYLFLSSIIIQSAHISKSHGMCKREDPFHVSLYKYDTIEVNWDETIRVNVCKTWKFQLKQA